MRSGSSRPAVVPGAVPGRSAAASGCTVDGRVRGGPWALRVTAPTTSPEHGRATADRWSWRSEPSRRSLASVGCSRCTGCRHRRATTRAADPPNRAGSSAAPVSCSDVWGVTAVPPPFPIDLDHFKPSTTRWATTRPRHRRCRPVSCARRCAVRPPCRPVGRRRVRRGRCRASVTPRAVPARAATIANVLAAAPAIGAITPEASVGAALFPAHGQRLDDLMRHADRAMYAAKVHSTTHTLGGDLGGISATGTSGRDS